MSRVNDTVKDDIGYCRVTYHVIPIGRWVLRGYDDGLSFMPVFNNFEQYGTFPWHQEVQGTGHQE